MASKIKQYLLKGNGWVAQLARAFGSYPRGREFESLPSYKKESTMVCGFFFHGEILDIIKKGKGRDYVSAPAKAYAYRILYFKLRFQLRILVSPANKKNPHICGFFFYL